MPCSLPEGADAGERGVQRRRGNRGNESSAWGLHLTGLIPPRLHLLLEVGDFSAQARELGGELVLGCPLRRGRGRGRRGRAWRGGNVARRRDGLRRHLGRAAVDSGNDVTVGDEADLAVLSLDLRPGAVAADDVHLVPGIENRDGGGVRAGPGAKIDLVDPRDLRWTRKGSEFDGREQREASQPTSDARECHRFSLRKSRNRGERI